MDLQKTSHKDTIEAEMMSFFSSPVKRARYSYEFQKHLLDKYDIHIELNHLKKITRKISHEKQQRIPKEVLIENVKDYFNQSIDNKNGIKTYTINKIISFIKKNTGLEISPIIIEEIIKNLNIKNIKCVSRADHQEVEDIRRIINDYFNKLPKDQNGIKQYVLYDVVNWVKNVKNKKFRGSKIENEIKILDFKNIQRIDGKKKICPQIEEAINNYFNTLEPDSQGIKKYTFKGVHTFIKTNTNKSPTIITIKRIIKKINRSDTQYGVKIKGYLEDKFHLIKKYFDTLTPNKNGIKTYTIGGVSAFIKKMTNPDPATFQCLSQRLDFKTS